MKKPKGDYAIQAVINAIRLLETFRDEEEQGVTPLAKRLDLHKNNVFRLLATLEELGYIEQCAESDRYRLGVRSLELGQSFGRSRNLLRRARPVIDELVETCGESAHLGLLREMQVVHVEGPESIDGADVAGADYLLVDSGRPSDLPPVLGGTGRTHDWDLSRGIVEQARVPVFLAGGLTPENVDDAIRTVRPAGVDACSGLRDEGGRLDSELLTAFVRAVRTP